MFTTTLIWLRTAALLATFLIHSHPVFASEAGAEAPSLEPDGRVRVYLLESVELVGSTRTDSSIIERNLGLEPGTKLDDELVMSARQRLLGLGIFRSALLYMRKGSKPGYAKLFVEVEDDESVIGDYGLGGELSVTHGEPVAVSVDPNRPPLGYKIQLISRNLFRDLHRLSIMWDVDSEGVIREGQVAYGFPRFSREDIQFDAQVSAVDVATRYLDTLGYGARGEAIWSMTTQDYGKFQYGVAMFLNQDPRFKVPGFPGKSAGPKIGYVKETRLLGFLPSEGYLFGTSAVVSPLRLDESLVEFVCARTVAVPLALMTMEGRALVTGLGAVAGRLESRIDVPLSGSNRDEESSEIFLKLRVGQDQSKTSDLVGSAAIFGVRYYSNGLIAELALKITKTPQEFDSLLERENGG